MKFRYTLSAIAGLALAQAPLNAKAADLSAQTCNGQARNAMERLYCRIVAEGEGSGLPGLKDFRRNAPNIQTLLLKRPAKRLGLSLPPAAKVKPRRKKPATTHASRPAFKTKPAPRPNTQPVPDAQANVGIAPAPQTKPAPAVATRAQPTPLSQCRLTGEKIYCAAANYRLVLNKNNRELAEGALGADNRLALSDYTGLKGNKKNIRHYLSVGYKRYIQKMLDIGLGASTMSFSKFFYTYQEVTAKGENFAKRFETMYGYLKKDKASMSVRARYHHQLPDNIGQCTELTTKLIVCDDQANNWVYSRDR